VATLSTTIEAAFAQPEGVPEKEQKHDSSVCFFGLVIFLMLSASQRIFFFQETVKKCRKLPKVSGTYRKVTNSAGNCQFPLESNNFCRQKLFCRKLAKME
jgi:hypothetical protein